MTNFAVQSTTGALAPLGSKDKGTIGNRMDCAGAHIKNTVTAGVQTAALGAATIGATKVVANNMYGFTGITKLLSKSFDYAMKGLGKLTKIPDLDKQVTEKLTKFINNVQIDNNKATKEFTKTITKVPGFKALAVIAAATLPVLGYIVHNHSYKSGQIDQKYTDRAKMAQNLV